ncbi:baculoviral IAP repeat-containing protein 1-like [Protopterus annectens]|uniref:baculoviral IAP repeat-containing protein 1-like n=1 Tax=Protopterus annectens TaxID=7888 RepID=UPI001CFACF43|nr:baculoviral IAP repeat-containing protein 1-like [Protopterus annectens]
METKVTDSCTAENKDDSGNWELDLSYIQSLQRFQNTDMSEQIAEMEKEYKKIREQRDKTFNYEMRSELKRLKSFSTWKKDCTYSPQEMAAAGFYYTGLQSSYQCFCCGIVICTTSCRSTPFDDHKKFQPECLFVQGKDAGNIPRYDVRVRVPQVIPAEELNKYKQEEARLESFEKWPFYAKMEPAILAAAGFFFTGKKDTVQCFSCNESLANWEVDDDPWKEHAKWFPECEYLQSKKSKEEINQYVKNYSGFIGVTGKHYVTEVAKIRELEETCIGTGNLEPDLNIFADEDVRLESFKTWPKDAKKSPRDLAAAGFFYIGKDDVVSCFCCGKYFFKWEEDDDPWKDHESCFYDCRYLAAKRAELQKRENASSNLSSSVQESESSSMEYHFSHPSGMPVVLEGWINIARNLHLQLTKKYKSTEFSKLFPFHHSSYVSVDIRYIYSELSMNLKNTKNQTLQETVTLPELLRSLHDVTIIEGEAGSGKSALLKKIAVMWASGCCPLLDRFQLVFYICLGSLNDNQRVADVISNQLLGPNSSLSEASLKNMLERLKNRILFLLDGYGEASSIPKQIEELVHKNHIDKLCIVIATRSNQISRVRRFASTILSITDFPFYSIMYMLKKLFSHDSDFLKTLGINVIASQTLQRILKSPLFALVICISYVQHPKSDIYDTTAICKAYVMYNTLKYSEEPQKMTTSMMLCGKLALKSFFKSCVEFTDKDLSEAQIDGDEAIRFGFLNKFTAQRPHPVYKFLHPYFQEYLAGKTLSEYFESDLEDDIRNGLQFLQQIDTFLKIAGRYYFILKHACGLSPKATPRIISYILDVTKSNNFLDCQSEGQTYLNYHPEQRLTVETLLAVLQLSNPENACQYVTHFLLNLVLNGAYKSNSVLESSSQILRFLEGKTLYFTTSELSENALLHFLEDYPESFLLLHSICFTLVGSVRQTNVFSEAVETLLKQSPQTVEEEYIAAYQVFNVAVEDQTINAISSAHKRILRHVPEYFITPFVAAKRCNKKLKVLKLNVDYMDSFKDSDQTNLIEVLAIAAEIELSLHKSKGFTRIIKPAIEHYSTLFTKCSIYESELNEEDQKLIQLMTSLRSIELRVSKEENPPGIIIIIIIIIINFYFSELNVLFIIVMMLYVYLCESRLCVSTCGFV